ncbi:hypothetical protein Scep_029820 [Stephania cephalantha]|uniref:Uncharacterized protein n=1 Tax=Stephania cephalantha TaxID=152367 RepID=A0AAP0E637_9MAGN
MSHSAELPVSFSSLVFSPSSCLGPPHCAFCPHCTTPACHGANHTLVVVSMLVVVEVVENFEDHQSLALL